MFPVHSHSSCQMFACYLFIINLFILLQALISLALLTYVHYAFTRHPVNCLQHLTSQHRSWLRDGIVRIEIMRNASPNYTLMDSYHKEFAGSRNDLYEESIATVPASSQGQFCSFISNSQTNCASSGLFQSFSTL